MQSLNSNNLDVFKCLEIQSISMQIHWKVYQLIFKVYVTRQASEKITIKSNYVVHRYILMMCTTMIRDNKSNFPLSIPMLKYSI